MKEVWYRQRTPIWLWVPIYVMAAVASFTAGHNRGLHKSTPAAYEAGYIAGYAGAAQEIIGCASRDDHAERCLQALENAKSISFAKALNEIEPAAE